MPGGLGLLPCISARLRRIISNRAISSGVTVMTCVVDEVAVLLSLLMDSGKELLVAARCRDMFTSDRIIRRGAGTSEAGLCGLGNGGNGVLYSMSACMMGMVPLVMVVCMLNMLSLPSVDLLLPMLGRWPSLFLLCSAQRSGEGGSDGSESSDDDRLSMLWS